MRCRGRNSRHRTALLILLALFLTLLPCAAWAKIVRCKDPHPGAGVHCPKICVEYETEVMRVGETQTVAIQGGLQPYSFYCDQGWETFEIKPITQNSFSITATNRTVGSGARGWAQFNFEDSKKCPSGRVEFQVVVGTAPPSASPPPALPPPHPSPLPTSPSPLPFPSPLAKPLDLNGYWLTSTKDTADAPVIIFQEGTEVRMMCTFEYQGKMVAWYSAGTISGNSVRTRFRITANTKPKEWEADGTHELTLSPDGRSLSGTGRSQSGFTYGIQFKRVK